MKKSGKKTLFKILLGFVILLSGLFLVYITNTDGKMVEQTYNLLIKYHDQRDDIVETL